MTHIRARVIKRVQGEYKALDRIVEQLSPADFRTPAMREEAVIRFTAKDVLAHITAWKWRQVRVVRAMLLALRAAPAGYFAKQRSAQWPFDAVGHVDEHRRKHLEPLLAARRSRRSKSSSS